MDLAKQGIRAEGRRLDIVIEILVVSFLQALADFRGRIAPEPGHIPKRDAAAEQQIGDARANRRIACANAARFVLGALRSWNPSAPEV